MIHLITPCLRDGKRTDNTKVYKCFNFVVLEKKTMPGLNKLSFVL